MPRPAARARRARPGIARLPVRELHHHPFVRADGVGVRRDFLQARFAHEIEITAPVTGEREIERLTFRGHELHQRQVGALPQRAQIRHLEGLNADRIASTMVAMPVQRLEQPLVEEQPGLCEVTRMLGFRVDADARQAA